MGIGSQNDSLDRTEDRTSRIHEVCTHLHLNITVRKPRRKRRIPGLLLFHTYAPCAINVLMRLSIVSPTIPPWGYIGERQGDFPQF